MIRAQKAAEILEKYPLMFPVERVGGARVLPTVLAGWLPIIEHLCGAI